LRQVSLPTFCRSLSPAGHLDRLPLAEPAVGQLHVRQQGAVVEHRAAHPGAQGDHQFHAGALDDRAALHVGVVGHPHRLAEPLGQRALQVEPEPQVDQFLAARLAGAGPDERGHLTDDAGADRAGEAHRHPVVGRLRGGQRGELVEEDPRRARVGGLPADPLGGHLTVGGQHRRLEARPADVDRQGQRSVHGARPPRSRRVMASACRCSGP
jgi:hypothetical protein